jgi:membrane-associated phospholipid phosphatase
MPSNRHRALLIAAVFMVAFGIVAVLVVTGEFQWLDQYAVDHWMPGFVPAASSSLEWRGLWRPFPLATPAWQWPLALWTYPASFLVSGLVVLGASVILWRRRQARVALIWIVAWLLGNGLELVGKSTLPRPAFSRDVGGDVVAMVGFHNSFPSGHTIRGLVVVGLVVLLWPKARWPLAGWFVLVGAFLVVLADHTPSDVLGGLWLGLAIVLVAWTASRTAWARVPAPG